MDIKEQVGKLIQEYADYYAEYPGFRTLDETVEEIRKLCIEDWKREFWKEASDGE